MANTPTRRSGLAASVLFALAAVVIGCGGGGGGGGSTSSTSSSATATSTAGTLTNGGTGGTNGSLGGLLQADSIYYATYNGSDYDVKFTKADGTGSGTYASGVPSEGSAAAIDPQNANRVYFAAKPSGSTRYGIYRNSTPTLDGSQTTVVSPTYFGVPSIQISRDGSTLIFLGTASATGARQLYKSGTAAGSTPTLLDQAETVALSPAGDRVVYEKYASDAATDTDLYVRVFTETTSHRLTDNALFDQEPQFSTDGTTVVFSQEVAGGAGRYQLARINLSTAVVTTFDPSPSLDQERAPSLNGNGTKVAYVGIGSATNTTGLYVADFPTGANATKVATDLNIGYGTHWTNAQGRALNREPLNLSLSRRK